MHSDKKIPSEQGLLAAVDLGSNSFRLLIGRIERSELGEQIRALDSLKVAVRLAAGLGPDNTLDTASRLRGLSALARFGERLRAFEPETVRAVATNSLRVAKNASAFLVPAQTALGFPIEVISGREEARLIYIGAAHALPLDSTHRLVVDIGGGSTELIIGKNDRPRLFESAPIGCVSLSMNFFRDGRVTTRSLEAARLAARDALAPYAEAYRRHGWQYAVGTSGTAKSLMQIAEDTLGERELTAPALETIGLLLAREGNIDNARLPGLRADRRPVLPGGLALMLAVFDEFGVSSMRYCNGALRQGALYDLLGRSSGHDMRAITVAQMTERYGVDSEHAQRVAAMACALFEQIANGNSERITEDSQLLAWAARLAEVGLSISHDSFHKHSAYILSNADMPGFSRSEQQRMANLALGQTGGLRKLRGTVREAGLWPLIFCLRVASIMYRRRDGEMRPLPRLTRTKGGLRLELPRDWASINPLTDETLATEARAWADIDAFDNVEYFLDG